LVSRLGFIPPEVPFLEKIPEKCERMKKRLNVARVSSRFCILSSSSSSVDENCFLFWRQEDLKSSINKMNIELALVVIARSLPISRAARDPPLKQLLQDRPAESEAIH